MTQEEKELLLKDLCRMNITKFCYERITGKSYDEYIDYLKEKGFALEAPEDMYNVKGE